MSSAPCTAENHGWKHFSASSSQQYAEKMLLCGNCMLKERMRGNAWAMRFGWYFSDISAFIELWEIVRNAKTRKLIEEIAMNNYYLECGWNRVTIIRTPTDLRSYPTTLKTISLHLDIVSLGLSKPVLHRSHNRLFFLHFHFKNPQKKDWSQHGKYSLITNFLRLAVSFHFFSLNIVLKYTPRRVIRSLADVTDCDAKDCGMSLLSFK